MKHIFEPVHLGNLCLKNRLVRSATMENAAITDGRITPALKETYEELARGGVGLIITGMMGIGPDSRVSPEMAATEHATFHDNLQALADAVHTFGSKLVVQLSHCGVKVTQFDTIDTPRGPSPFTPKHGQSAVEMTQEEIAQISADFAAAALRCKEAGADGIQLHCAHGYLLSQFLSPYYNQRTDEYGGSIEHRAKIVLDTYQAIRQAVGAEYPILIKINYSDLVEGGLTGDECAFVCKSLDALRIDAIEVSSGLNVSRDSSASPRMVDGKLQSFAEAGKNIASLVDAAVISVGGHRNSDIIEQFLNESRVAAVSMSRPFLREPDLAAKWEVNAASPAKCISCNQCFKGEYLCKLTEHNTH